MNVRKVLASTVIGIVMVTEVVVGFPLGLKTPVPMNHVSTVEACQKLAGQMEAARNKKNEEIGASHRVRIRCYDLDLK
jgi:hypothetical protein